MMNNKESTVRIVVTSTGIVGSLGGSADVSYP